MDRSVEFLIPEHVANAARNDLPREVLSYADGLVRQAREILDRHGVTLEDLKRQEVREKVPAEDLRLLRELAAKNAAVRRGEINATARREIEEIRAERDAAFSAHLREVAKAFLDGYQKSRAIDPKRPSAWTEDLARVVEEGPAIPEERFLEDSRAMQLVLDGIAACLPPDHLIHAGLIASMLVNRSVRDVPVELRSKIRQSVSVGGIPFQYLGYEWSAGELSISGMAGECVGRSMTGGTVIAQACGDYAGMNMAGGTLRIDTGVPTANLGCMMSGGMILANGAKEKAGYGMSGGEIRIRGSAGDFAGVDMREGTIVAERFGINAGVGMHGGRIEAGSASVGLGKQMWGGEIVIGEAINAGESMRGGKIHVSRHVAEVANGMTGGTVELAGTVEKIVRIGEKDELGIARTGGTVRFVGTNAWWKNLWIK